MGDDDDIVERGKQQQKREKKNTHRPLDLRTVRLVGYDDTLKGIYF